MIFPLIGFYFLYKENRKIFYPILIYFLLSFWLISSWTEWWYGASYSIRPLVTQYPLLADPFGYLLIYLGTRKRSVQFAAGILFLFFVFLNQFQWWQLRNFILDPYRTTREYNWAIFLKTKVDAQAEKLRSVYRDFSGKYEFNNPEDYTGSTLKEMNFEGEKGKQIISDTTGNSFYRFSEDQYFKMIFEKRYKEKSKEDHFRIKARIDARFPDNFKGTCPCLVITMNRREGVYAYLAKELRPEPENSGWNTFRADYLTPEIRSRSDYFQCYVWKRGEEGFDIDNIRRVLYRKEEIGIIDLTAIQPRPRRILFSNLPVVLPVFNRKGKGVLVLLVQNACPAENPDSAHIIKSSGISCTLAISRILDLTSKFIMQFTLQLEQSLQGKERNPVEPSVLRAYSRFLYP